MIGSLCKNQVPPSKIVWVNLVLLLVGVSAEVVDNDIIVINNTCNKYKAHVNPETIFKYWINNQSQPL